MRIDDVDISGFVVITGGKGKEYPMTNLQAVKMGGVNYLDFTAIDFETGSGYRNSVCQVGLVRVERGVIVETYSSLIRPRTTLSGRIGRRAFTVFRRRTQPTRRPFRIVSRAGAFGTRFFHHTEKITGLSLCDRPEVVYYGRKSKYQR